MPDRLIKLSFLTAGADKVKQTIFDIGRSADEVSRERKVPIAVDDVEGQKKLADLKLKLDILGKKVVTARADVNDSAGRAKLIDLELRLRKLSVYVAGPKITLNGVDSTLARIFTVDAALSRLSGKAAKVDISGNAVSGGGGFGQSLQKTAASAKAGFGPAWLGPALLAAPAAASIAGVAGGAAIGLGGAFVAAAGALAAFGAVAKPVFASALTAEQKVNTAQNTYNAAIAAGVKPATAYKAQQLAIGKAYADLSPQQIALSKQLGSMAQAWQHLKAAQTPVVAGALQPWLKSVTDLTKNLAPIIASIAPVIKGLGTQFDILMTSSAFKDFAKWIGTTGAMVTKAAGGALIDLLTGITFLLPQFTPLIKDAANGILKWGDAFVRWASSQKAANEIHNFLDWFAQNGPAVGQLLKNIGGALKALAPGLGAGAVTELKLLSGFFGFIAKLPPSIAKPLLDVAGVLLILNKLGIVSVGVKMLFPKAGAGKAALAVSLGARLVAGAFIVPLTAMLVGSIVPKDMSKQAQADMKKQPGVILKIDNFLHITGMAEWVDQYLSHPVRAWAETSLPHFLGVARHDISTVFDGIRHDIAHRWDLTWNETIGRIIRGVHDVTAWFDNERHNIAVRFDGIRHDIAAKWNQIWNDTIGRIIRGVADVVSYFRGLPGKVINAISGLAGSATRWAGGVIGGMLSGFHSAWSSVINWFTSVPKRILSALGIHSPPQWAIDAGKHIMAGLNIGLGHGLGSVQSFTTNIGATVANALGSAFSGGGSAVSWLTTAMKDTGAPASWLRGLETVMSAESGGNPRAYNPTSVGGEHAEGLMQMLPSTYAAFATVPGGIWNPISNAVASIRYIMSQYGSPYNIPGLGTSGYRGYAGGGWLTEPVAGIGTRSGMRYALAEHGPELVTPQNRVTNYGGSNHAGNVYINVTAGPMAHPADVGREVVGAIKQFEKRSGKGWRS